MILTAIGIATVSLGVGVLIMVVESRLDDNRVRDPQLTLNGESVEPMPEETIGVFDGSESETAETGGSQ